MNSPNNGGDNFPTHLSVSSETLRAKNELCLDMSLGSGVGGMKSYKQFKWMLRLLFVPWYAPKFFLMRCNTCICSSQVRTPWQTEVQIPTKSNLWNNNFYWSYSQTYVWGDPYRSRNDSVQVKLVSPLQHGWQITKAGHLEHTAQPASSSKYWRVAFPGTSVLTSFRHLGWFLLPGSWSGLAAWLLWESSL